MGEHTIHSGAGGNRALFEALYAAHHRILHAFLVGQVGHGEVAADLLQETFLRVWKNIAVASQIMPDQQRFWLLALARNVANDHHRRASVRQHIQAPLPDEGAIPADATADPAVVYAAKETQVAIDRAIRDLPVDLRTPLTLYLLGEMTSQEIGDSLGIPAGTVRYRISQARQRIAEQLNPGTKAGTIPSERKNHGKPSR